jgi:hypothetical protein
LSKQDAVEQVAARLRNRYLSWNHEQGQFSKIEGLGIMRTEHAFNKRFKPSDIEGVDFIDPKGWGNVSLKGPFLDLKFRSSNLAYNHT